MGKKEGCDLSSDTLNNSKAETKPKKTSPKEGKKTKEGADGVKEKKKGKPMISLLR